MGVMECQRADCTNILCDRHSQEHGYLCGSCISELIERGPTSIAKFMRTPRVDCMNNEAWEGIINREFPAAFDEESL